MKDNKPAYPHPSAACGRGYDGLTRRELFAAMAMQGMLDCNVSTELSVDDFMKAMSTAAVGFSDALIAELEKDSG